MRRGLFCGLAGLILVTACGPQPAAKTPHVYVVVQHLHGSWLERRVDFSGGAIDGVTAMNRSGFEYKTQGNVTCQVDNEPATFAVCIPPDKPYWALYVESQGKWTNQPGGLSAVRLRDGDAIGWHYVWASEASPPPTPHQI